MPTHMLPSDLQGRLGAPGAPVTAPPAVPLSALLPKTKTTVACAAAPASTGADVSPQTGRGESVRLSEGWIKDLLTGAAGPAAAPPANERGGQEPGP